MIPVEKNKEYQIEITSVSSEGNGIGSIGGYAVFVPQTVRGDRVIAEIVKTRSRYGIGRLKRIISPSPHRIKPPCRSYGRCGGCQLMHMDYAEQLFVKRNIVENALKRIGGFKDFTVEPICGMEKPFRYRNKLIFQVGNDAEGKPVCGFYENKSHSIATVSDCLTGDEQNKKIVGAVLEYMRENSVSAYDEKTGKGIVRGVFLRKSAATGEIMTVICSAVRELPARDRLIVRLAELGVSSVILNINTKRTSLALGAENITLCGEDHITDALLGIKFKISPHSFFQVNPLMTEKLYSKALEYAGLNGNETVLDIYCGIGTISLCAAKLAKRVIGVELAEQAIRDAEENKSLNGIDNAEFYAGNSESIVPRLIKRGERPDVVILDPPRRGSDEKTLSAIISAEPERIVYVSCEPSTLARDLRYLAQNGYRLDKASPFDMFPQTGHVETVCQLVLRRSPVHINIDVDVEELMQAKRGQATYEQIKAYVLEHYGVNVSQLNIAQVKRKCGIIERENYNKAKNGDAKQPNCTPEKEAAIMETLRHFGMI